MNKKKFFLLLISSCSIMGFRMHGQKEDESIFKKVLTEYFDGIKNFDTVEMKAVTTRDFATYEEGKGWNNDSVFSQMRRIAPYKVDFEFDHFNITSDSKLGFMYYEEKAHFVVRDTVKFNLNYMGSACFKKEDGEWKMAFLHSTQKYAPKKK